MPADPGNNINRTAGQHARAMQQQNGVQRTNNTQQGQRNHAEGARGGSRRVNRLTSGTLRSFVNNVSHAMHRGRQQFSIFGNGNRAPQTMPRVTPGTTGGPNGENQITTRNPMFALPTRDQQENPGEQRVQRLPAGAATQQNDTNGARQVAAREEAPGTRINTAPARLATEGAQAQATHAQQTQLQNTAAERFNRTTLPEQVESVSDIHDIQLFGIPDNHVATMATISNDMNLVFGIRPISPLAKSLLENGAATKGMGDKAKSAARGPIAGLIPHNQALSKLEGGIHNEAGTEKIARFNGKAMEAVRDGEVALGNLTLTHARLEELSALDPKMDFQQQIDGSVTINFTGDSGDDYVFQGRPLLNANTAAQQYEISLNGSPVQIHCDTSGELRPITGDYDLLLVAPLLSDYGEKDLVHSDRPHTELEQHVSTHFNSSRLLSPLPEKEGILSPRVQELNQRINQDLGREDNKVMHHGADEYNPYTEEGDNYPAIFFLPEPVGEFGQRLDGQEGAVAIIHEQDMPVFIKALKDNGYYTHMHDQWSNSLKDIRSDSFVSARNLFENSSGALSSNSAE